MRSITLLQTSSFGCGGFGSDAVLPVRDDEPDDADDENELYAEMEAMEDSLESRVGIPLSSELHSDVGQRVAPGPRADESIDVETKLVHLRDAGRKGNEGANDGEHPPYQYGDGAVVGEEAVYAIEIAPTEEHVAAVTFDHGASAVRTHPVGRDGAEVGGQGRD